jgi:hypothetical protein
LGLCGRENVLARVAATATPRAPHETATPALEANIRRVCVCVCVQRHDDVRRAPRVRHLAGIVA